MVNTEITPNHINNQIIVIIYYDYLSYWAEQPQVQLACRGVLNAPDLGLMIAIWAWLIKYNDITHTGPVKPSYNVGKAKAKFGNEQARFFVWRAHLHPSTWVIVAIVIQTLAVRSQSLNLNHYFITMLTSHCMLNEKTFTITFPADHTNYY